jgi:uncharacterized protein (DUF433 family)
MPARKLSGEQEQEIVERYLQGATVKALALQFGCSTQPVTQALRRRGVPMRSYKDYPHGPSPQRRFTDGVECEIAESYVAGESVTSLVERFGAPRATIYGLLERMDTPMRSGAPARLFSSEDAQEIIAAYQAGRSLEELAVARGCTRWTVTDVLERAGVERREVGGRWREFTAAELADIAQRWNAGESQDSIARSFHMAQPVLSRALANAGITGPRWSRSGPGHSAWKGGRHIDGNGYVQVWLAPDDPLAAMRMKTNGRALEHRLAMARHLGRPLRRNETVHHKNGDKTDNRIENLQLRNGNHGKGRLLRCADCSSHNIIAVPI